MGQSVTILDSPRMLLSMQISSEFLNLIHNNLSHTLIQKLLMLTALPKVLRLILHCELSYKETYSAKQPKFHAEDWRRVSVWLAPLSISLHHPQDLF